MLTSSKKNVFFVVVLQPSNLKIKLKIAATHSLQNYTRPMFDAQIDLEHINLNINRNQVHMKNLFLII